MPKRIHPTTPRYCLFCKKIIERPFLPNSKYKISWKMYQTRKFCNNRCKGKWYSINNAGKNNYHWLGGKSICINCGKQLSYHYQKKVKCKSCWSKSINGFNNPNWQGGKTIKKCKICGKKIWKYSTFCKECYRGKIHHSWKGGISSLTDKIRQLPKYRQWYMKIFERDNFTCQSCKIQNVKLSAHHIKGLASILYKNNIILISQALKCKELWNISNGITLCHKCHKLTDNFAKKHLINKLLLLNGQSE